MFEIDLILRSRNDSTDTEIDILEDKKPSAHQYATREEYPSSDLIMQSRSDNEADMNRFEYEGEEMNGFFHIGNDKSRDTAVAEQIHFCDSEIILSPTEQTQLGISKQSLVSHNNTLQGTSHQSFHAVYAVDDGFDAYYSSTDKKIYITRAPGSLIPSRIFPRAYAVDDGFNVLYSSTDRKIYITRTSGSFMPSQTPRQKHISAVAKSCRLECSNNSNTAELPRLTNNSVNALMPDVNEFAFSNDYEILLGRCIKKDEIETNRILAEETQCKREKSSSLAPGQDKCNQEYFVCVVIAAIRVQSFFRGFLVRKSIELLDVKATTIQTFCRRYFAELLVCKLLVSLEEKKRVMAVQIQRHYRGYCNRLGYRLIKSCALKIQTHYRVFDAKKRCEKRLYDIYSLRSASWGRKAYKEQDEQDKLRMMKVAHESYLNNISIDLPSLTWIESISKSISTDSTSQSYSTDTISMDTISKSISMDTISKSISMDTISNSFSIDSMKERFKEKVPMDDRKNKPPLRDRRGKSNIIKTLTGLINTYDSKLYSNKCKRSRGTRRTSPKRASLSRRRQCELGKSKKYC